MRLEAWQKMLTPSRPGNRDENPPHSPHPRPCLAVHTLASLKLASDFVVTKGEVAAATIDGEVDARAAFDNLLLMPREGAMNAAEGSLARHTMAAPRASARRPIISMPVLSQCKVH